MHKNYIRILAPAAFAVLGAWAGVCAPGDIASYQLSPGDKITVMVFGQPDLSGDHLVDASGTIQVPLIGSLLVKTATLEECGRLITSRLSDGVLKKPTVVVQLKELRPIYVLGEVRAPGSYPFRFGLSALGAVAIAGGYGSAEARGGTVLADLLTVEERVNVLSAMRRSLLVRLSRLEAERDGRSSFEIPTEPKPADGRALEAVVQKEQEQLNVDNAAYENTVSLLRLQRAKLVTEVAAVQEEIKSEKRRLDISEDTKKVYEKLLSQGLSRRLTQSDIDFRHGQTEANYHRLEIENARLNKSIGAVDLKIRESDNTRRLHIVNEIRETQSRLQETEISLTSAKALLKLRHKQSGKTATTDGMPITYVGRLMRSGATEPITIQIDEDTESAARRYLGNQVASKCF